MIPSLSTYGGLLHDPGYDGQVVDLNSADIQNFMNDAAVVIPFGGPVARSAADQLTAPANGTYPMATCKAPAIDASVPFGFAVRHAIRPAAGYGQTSANVVQYVQNDEVPVLRRGQMYKIALENATRGDGVIMVTAASAAGTNAAGSVTGGAAAAGRVAVPNAVWETTTSAGALGIISINL